MAVEQCISSQRPQSICEEESWRITYSDEDVFLVMLKRHAEDHLFGIAYRAVYGSSLVVTALVEGSLADEWNAACDDSDRICVGDEIVSVNAECACRCMVDELRNERTVVIRFAKIGPRWHVSGIVAQSLRMVNDAKQYGVELEFRSVSTARASVVSVSTDSSTLSVASAFMVLACTAIPNLLCILLLSDIGFGITLFTTFASPQSNALGNLGIGASVALAVALFVVDWTQWENRLHQFICGCLVVGVHCGGWLLKSMYYPFAMHVVLLFFIMPVLLGIVKSTALKQVKRRKFYAVAAAGLLLMAFTVLCAWLTWILLPLWDGDNKWTKETKLKLADETEAIYRETSVSINGRTRHLDYSWDCRPDTNRLEDIVEPGVSEAKKESTGYVLTRSELSVRSKNCATVATIWVLIWITPCIVSGVNLVMGFFCLLNGFGSDTKEISEVERVLKQSAMMMGGVIFCMWVSSTIAGSDLNLNNTIFGFCGAALVVLVFWVYVEVGKQAITSKLMNSRMMQSMISIASWNVTRACFIIAVGWLIPFAVVALYLQQKVRILRGMTKNKLAFSPSTYRILHYLASWTWGDVLSNVNIICILAWIWLVGVMKVTVVFLSFLNETLTTWNLGLVLVSFFVIGFTMFMLPPVPGIPVYVMAGIIIPGRCRSIEAIGFWGGVVIAAVLALVLKLVACCGQYSIGYFLGRSVKVRALVGVDKLLIRAVERILQVKGLTVPKVSVLIGGPDWPVSVLTGILRLNLFQCLLGTTPCILLSGPCVLAGAFMLGPNLPSTQESKAVSDEKALWDQLTTLMTAFSLVVQGASGCIAMYYMQQVAFRHEEELSAPRAIDEPVSQLRLAEAEMLDCYQQVMSWRSLSLPERTVLTSASISLLISMSIFQFLSESCWRSFEMDNQISAPHDEDGLAGNVLTIIKPTGKSAMGLFVVGCIMHLCFSCRANEKTKRLLASRIEGTTDMREGNRASRRATL